MHQARFLLGAMGFLLLGALCLFAQPAPPADSLRAANERVDITSFPRVQLQFQMVNAQGEPVKQLPDEDFVILEDGREVYRFRPTGTQREPLFAVLAIDTSGSMERATRDSGLAKLAAAKEASGRFFDKLEAKTPCGLVLFHHETYHLEPLTTDRGKLRSLVNDAKPLGGTAWYDAAFEAVRLVQTNQDAGQRAVVVMTDGRDVNSKHVLEDVIQEAKRTRTRVHTIGLGEPGRNEFVRTLLVLDRSLSMQGKKFENMQKAASRFVTLLPPDAADTAILPFDHDVEVVDRFVMQKPPLLEEIQRLVPRGETALYDAIYEGIETLNAAEPADGSKRRRALIVLSDGSDTNSRRRETDVIERALADGVPIYVLGLGEPGEINEPVMQQIAKETHGEYFHVRDPEQLTAIFERLSIRLHDDGIDENALRKLASATGGEYYPVQDADRLKLLFDQVATQLETTFSVTFDSKRRRHDGTARGLEIRLGDVAVGRAGYVTHGLITPMSDPGLYLGMLALLLSLILVPGLIRWFGRGVRSDVA